MFAHKQVVYLRSTDATGVLFFSELLQFSQQAFEAFLYSCNFFLADLIGKAPFLMPIVHAEADYLTPLFVGCEVEIQLSLKEIKTSSFSLQAEIFDLRQQVVAGRTKIVHVTVSKTTQKAIPLPSLILEQLQRL